MIFGELIVGEILVEGLNDPVAVRGVITVVIVVVAIGVCDADQIQPILRHMFAISGLRQEPVDEILVGFRRGIGEEFSNFL